eukprot:SAG31_NODE_2341_length_5913_cov_2.173689_3_plen_489_part_00
MLHRQAQARIQANAEAATASIKNAAARVNKTGNASALTSYRLPSGQPPPPPKPKPPPKRAVAPDGCTKINDDRVGQQQARPNSNVSCQLEAAQAEIQQLRSEIARMQTEIERRQGAQEAALAAGRKELASAKLEAQEQREKRAKVCDKLASLNKATALHTVQQQTTQEQVNRLQQVLADTLHSQQNEAAEAEKAAAERDEAKTAAAAAKEVAAAAVDRAAVATAEVEQAVIERDEAKAAVAAAEEAVVVAKAREEAERKNGDRLRTELSTCRQQLTAVQANCDAAQALALERASQQESVTKILSVFKAELEAHRGRLVESMASRFCTLRVARHWAAWVDFCRAQRWARREAEFRNELTHAASAVSIDRIDKGSDLRFVELDVADGRSTASMDIESRLVEQARAQQQMTELYQRKVRKLEEFVDGSRDAFARQQTAVYQQLVEAAKTKQNLEADLSQTKLVAAEMARDNRKLAAGVEAANELLKAHGLA